MKFLMAVSLKIGKGKQGSVAYLPTKNGKGTFFSKKGVNQEGI